MPPADGDHRLRHSISGLLQSGLYTDAKIECDDNVFRVHKAIICSQSEYFARAFNKDSGFKEANTNTVTLHEILPSTVRAIIQYLYNGHYEVPDDLQERLTLSIDVYTAAEMYQIQGLKTFAAEDFSGVSHDMFTLPTFPDAVRAIYQGTIEQDRGLRDELVTAAADQINQLLLKPAFNSVLEECGAFGKDLLHAIAPAQKGTILGRKTITVRCWKPGCRYESTVDVETLETEGNRIWCNRCERAIVVEQWLPVFSCLSSDTSD